MQTVDTCLKTNLQWMKKDTIILQLENKIMILFSPSSNHGHNRGEFRFLCLLELASPLARLSVLPNLVSRAE